MNLHICLAGDFCGHTSALKTEAGERTDIVSVIAAAGSWLRLNADSEGPSVQKML